MRILFAQRSLSPPGGGNAVAAWMIHALVRDHHVSTITSRRWSESEINAFYGTTIPDGAVTQHVVPAPWRWLATLPEDRMTRLRLSSVLRYARDLSDEADLVITADNFGAFRKPGIQYVHFPAHLQPSPARWTAIVTMYFSACNVLLRGRWIDAAQNITLANSQWTADGLARLGEVSRPTVLYPPVIDPGEGLPWQQRDDVFLCIGRYHGAKRIEQTISIVQKIRQSALPHARLKVVGSAVDAEYTQRLRRLVARLEADWIEFHEDLSRDALNRLMGRSRYGLQSMEYEHFGMATAEMTRAGCIVFAHRSGGSPEVLNQEDGLLFESEDDAVEKFQRLDAAAIRPRLRAHSARFSAERFVEQFRSIVATSVGGSQDR